MRSFEKVMYSVKITLEALKSKKKKQEIKNLIVMVHRLSRIFDWSYAAARDDPNDIFYNVDGNNSDARLLLSCLDFSMPEDLQDHRNVLEKRVEGMYEGIAIAMRGFKHKTLVGQLASSVKWSLYYKWKDNKTIWDHGNFLYSTLDKNSLLRAFKLVQSNFVQNKFENDKSLPDVGLSEVFLVPISKDDVIQRHDSENPETPVMIDEDLDLNFVKLYDDYDQTTHYKVRLNCHEDWGTVDWKKCQLLDEGMSCVHFECVVVYYHGGGFITGSSNVYQEYTRIWANETKFPVFSIDYRLAPEFAFPDGLTDCWQSYLWLIKYSKKYLRMSFDKIIIMGDSAGGNLILGITNLAIIKNVRVPDGVNAVYPACDVSRISFSPSILLALDDVFLSNSFLSI
jgi:hypothetical protein